MENSKTLKLSPFKKTRVYPPQKKKSNITHWVDFKKTFFSTLQISEVLHGKKVSRLTCLRCWGVGDRPLQGARWPVVLTTWCAAVVRNVLEVALASMVSCHSSAPPDNSHKSTATLTHSSEKHDTLVLDDLAPNCPPGLSAIEFSKLVVIWAKIRTSVVPCFVTQGVH